MKAFRDFNLTFRRSGVWGFVKVIPLVRVCVNPHTCTSFPTQLASCDRSLSIASSVGHMVGNTLLPYLSLGWCPGAPVPLGPVPLCLWFGSGALVPVVLAG